MILFIDTTDNEKIRLALKEKRAILASVDIPAQRDQAEKLLPAIAGLLKRQKKDLQGLAKIEVADKGGSFTALRIGIATANALAYALGIPVVNKTGKNKLVSEKISIVTPKYGRKPNITQKKKKKNALADSLWMIC